jgi:hypothetical protein
VAALRGGRLGQSPENVREENTLRALLCRPMQNPAPYSFPTYRVHLEALQETLLDTQFSLQITEDLLAKPFGI